MVVLRMLQVLLLEKRRRSRRMTKKVMMLLLVLGGRTRMPMRMKTTTMLRGPRLPPEESHPRGASRATPGERLRLD